MNTQVTKACLLAVCVAALTVDPAWACKGGGGRGGFRGGGASFGGGGFRGAGFRGRGAGFAGGAGSQFSGCGTGFPGAGTGFSRMANGMGRRAMAFRNGGGNCFAGGDFAGGGLRNANFAGGGRRGFNRSQFAGGFGDSSCGPGGHAGRQPFGGNENWNGVQNVSTHGGQGNHYGWSNGGNGGQSNQGNHYGWSNGGNRGQSANQGNHYGYPNGNDHEHWNGVYDGNPVDGAQGYDGNHDHGHRDH